jgi:phosphonate transport system permease protein
VDLGLLFEGLPGALKNLALFLHPDWSVWPHMLGQAAVTVAISLLATPMAAVLSLALGLAAADNVSPAWLRWPVRAALGFERVLPDVFVLLVMVAALGLGPAPAVIALTFASLGMLGKLFADTIEDVDTRILDALRATGASYWQTVRYAVMPQVAPNLLASTIFRFEINVRAATLLGAVAGQGIGHELLRSVAYLEYGRASMAIIVTMLLVLVIESTSRIARSRIVAQGKLP